MNLFLQAALKKWIARTFPKTAPALLHRSGCTGNSGNGSLRHSVSRNSPATLRGKLEDYRAASLPIPSLTPPPTRTNQAIFRQTDQRNIVRIACFLIAIIQSDYQNRIDSFMNITTDLRHNTTSITANDAVHQRRRAVWTRTSTVYTNLGGRINFPGFRLNKTQPSNAPTIHAWNATE